MIETRQKINDLKQKVLSKIKEFAEIGNIEDIQKFTEILPKIQTLINNLDDIDVKINLLERNVHEIIYPSLNPINTTSNVPEIFEDDLSPRDKAKIKRNDFINNLIARGVNVHQFKGVTYRINKTSKLMGVAFSGEKDGSWFLGLPELDLKIIVLLCMKDDDDMYTIILPEDFCDRYIKHLSKSGGQLKFSLRKKRDEFLLYTKIGNIPINQFVNNYSAFTSNE